MDEEIQKALIDIAVLKTKLESWMINTELHRTTQNDKFNIIILEMEAIKKKLDSLPCDKREAWYQSMGRQVAFMWAIVTTVVIALFFEIFKKRA